MLAKISNFSKYHSCEPKIVPALLISVNGNNEIVVILWIDVLIKSPHYEILLKNANLMGKFYSLQSLQCQEIIDYTLNAYLSKFL